MSRALIDPATWSCRHCGGRERYKQGQCVECQRARMRVARHKKRLADWIYRIRAINQKATP